MAFLRKILGIKDKPANQTEVQIGDPTLISSTNLREQPAVSPTVPPDPGATSSTAPPAIPPPPSPEAIAASAGSSSGELSRSNVVEEVVDEQARSDRMAATLEGLQVLNDVIRVDLPNPKETAGNRSPEAIAAETGRVEVASVSVPIEVSSDNQRLIEARGAGSTRGLGKQLSELDELHNMSMALEYHATRNRSDTLDKVFSEEEIARGTVAPGERIENVYDCIPRELQKESSQEHYGATPKPESIRHDAMDLSTTPPSTPRASSSTSTSNSGAASSLESSQPDRPRSPRPGGH